jgi:SulP family sulfate permease
MTGTEIKTNVLCGLSVALALVPEAIAFAFVAHVSPGPRPPGKPA